MLGLWTAKKLQARTARTLFHLRAGLLPGPLLRLVTGLIRWPFLPPAKLSYPLPMLVLWTATKLQRGTGRARFRLPFPGLLRGQWVWWLARSRTP